MRSYTLLYSKIWKQVVAMVAVPLLIIFPSIAILIRYKNLGDITILIFSFIAMGVMILATLYIVFKQAMVEADIKITKEGLQVASKRKTLFNWKREKFIPFNHLAFVSDDIDINNNRKFFTLKVKGETGKLILIAPKKAPPGEIESFSSELAIAVEEYNANHSNSFTPIKKESFYTGKFAIFLNWLLIVAAILSTIIKIMDPSSIQWYRLIWLYIITACWLGNFYLVRKKLPKKINLLL